MSDEIAGWIKENMRGKMNITHIRWNTDKPKFEDVKGKYIIVEYEDGAHSHLTFIETEKTYRDLIVNNPILSNFKKYSVVDFSDEPAYCEWEKINEGEHKNYFRSRCCKDYLGVRGANRIFLPVQAQDPFCGHCGLPIKVIDELKPLPLMGIEPTFERCLVNTGVARIYINSEKFCISTPVADSDREAIESWNSLVGKLTGEKWVNLIATKRNTKTM